jgi:hypothetical protein
MEPQSEKNMGEMSNEATPKEWRRPVLRKLPIAVTEGAGKITGNEGGGGGKGDSDPPSTS